MVSVGNVLARHEDALDMVVKAYKDTLKHPHPCEPCKQSIVNQMRILLIRTSPAPEKRKEIEEIIAKELAA